MSPRDIHYSAIGGTCMTLAIRAMAVLLGLVLVMGGATARAQEVLPDIGPLRVRIEAGEIEGRVREASSGFSRQDGLEYRPGLVRVFRGIPYAAPPVGPLRWRPPQPAIKWEGVRETTGYSAVCPQPENPISPVRRTFRETDTRESEDCLTVNVWTPAIPEDIAAGRATLPVMIWIHGGGFTVGAGSEGIYDGGNLAARGAVVVTFNYRLGPFGFFAHPELSEENDQRISGNYGLMDQVFLLQWVRRNIAAFGGDENNVTIFGESAGAAAVSRLMVCPPAKGLFHKAIAQSGGPVGRNRTLREDIGRMVSAERMGERLQDRQGSSSLAELREMDAQELLAAAAPAVVGPGDKYGPIVDGVWLTEDPEASWQAGKQAAVPLIVGTNADDGSVFVSGGPVDSVLSYETAVRALYDEPAASQLLKLYPATSDEEARVTARKLVTATSFVYPAFVMAGSQQRVAPGQVFEYHFTRVPATRRARQEGAFHGLEIIYVFDNLPTANAGMWASAYADEDRQLASAMADAWVRFARTGSPDGDGLSWPARGPDRTYIEFGDKPALKKRLLPEAMDILEQAKPREIRR